MSVMGHNITNVTLNLIQGHIKMLIFSKDEMLKQVQHDAKNTHYDIKRIIRLVFIKPFMVYGFSVFDDSHKNLGINIIQSVVTK